MSLVGSVGTVLAVLYGARTYKHGVEVQQRDEELREKEHQELLFDKHEEARDKANRLQWSITKSRTMDLRFKEDEEQYQLNLEQKSEDSYDDVSHSELPPNGYRNLYVSITNSSSNTYFSDISLQFPKVDQRVCVKEMRIRSLSNSSAPSKLFDQYSSPNEHGVIHITGLKAQDQLLVHCEFKKLQDYQTWARPQWDPYKRLEGELALRFSDPKGRYWSRFFHMNPSDLFRSWTEQDNASEAELRANTNFNR